MGYDAFVRCNCYRDGKSTPPPISPSRWHINPEEGFIRENADLTDEEYRQLMEWERHGCEHKDQLYIHEHLGNIWTVGEARYLLHTYFTEDDIPVLYHMIPNCTDGSFPVEKAAAALEDIAFVRDNQWRIVSRLVGKICDTQGVNRFSDLYEVPGTDTLVIGTCHDGRLVKIGASGLFVQNAETQEILFQATRVHQVIQKPKAGLPQTRLEDADHPEQQLVLDIPPIGWRILKEDSRVDDGSIISLLEIQYHSLEEYIAEYRFEVLNVLERLLHASLETGNPIVWC